MENQYNYYNSDGMNGNGQSETPFHDDNGGQKHQVPVVHFWHQMLLEVKCWD